LYCVYVCIFVIYVEYFPYCLFVSNSQVIGCEDCLRNDLYCVGWGVKLYSVPSNLPQRDERLSWRVFWKVKVKHHVPRSCCALNFNQDRELYWVDPQEIQLKDEPKCQEDAEGRIDNTANLNRVVSRNLS